MTGINNLRKAEQRCKTYKDYTFCSLGIWDVQSVLFIRFLTEQRNINALYNSKLLEDRMKSGFRSKRRGYSVKSFSLFHNNARPNTDSEINATLEKIHWGWGYCHIPCIFVTWHQENFTCYVRLNGSWEKKSLDPTMNLNYLCNNGWKRNNKLFWKGRNEVALRIATVYRAAGRIRWKQVLLFRAVHFHKKESCITLNCRCLFSFAECWLMMWILRLPC